MNWELIDAVEGIVAALFTIPTGRRFWHVVKQF